jgi:nitric oxide reductase subunit C
MRRIIETVIFILILEGISLANQGSYQLPGDMKNGWKIFFEKGCIKCHSIWGEGGNIGPDITKSEAKYITQGGLVAAMWNHAPRMWKKMKEKGIQYNKLTKEEMSNIFALIYFLRSLDESGDPIKGEVVFNKKKCIICHSIRGKGGKVGPDLSKWGGYTNPLLWAGIMWNHAPKMEKEMANRGLKWPIFKGNEMVNLTAYIRSVAPVKERIFLSLGDPRNGRELFLKKRCDKCHSVGKEDKKIDLSKRSKFTRTLSQVAGLMWNHSPDMWRKMKKKGIGRPTLSAKDMVDIIAYLFSIRYFDEPGDKDNGKKLFSEKHCISCHRGKGRIAPDLTVLKGKISPVSMASAMWNHGPTMHEKMRDKGISWPEISPKEMVDIMEYINAGE